MGGLKGSMLNEFRKSSAFLRCYRVLIGPVMAVGLLATPAMAQQSGPVEPAPVEPAKSEAPPADQPSAITQVPGVTTSVPATPATPNWTAEAGAGTSARDNGPRGAFAVAALNRLLGQNYVRAALTGYRSTLRQADTALPSTYVVGTIGAGGNHKGWVFDGWASYGWQIYGEIAGYDGLRRSTLAKGSPYYAVGADAGRIVQLSPRLYVTPTLAVTYTQDRLLRPSPFIELFPDYQSNEPAWTGIAALRFDRRLGREGQHYIGLAGSWHVTNNGLSVLLSPAENNGVFGTRHYADGWGEIGVNASLRINPRLRLEVSALRSVEALAGNATTLSGGLRLAF
jgi:hypothetical protein